MLKATKDNYSYNTPHNHEQHVNSLLPLCKKDKTYPINILDKGYSGHYFELVEVQ